jgi:hypothetical protein
LEKDATSAKSALWIQSDPAIAAHLLLNISKMLCLRILKER